MTNGYKIVDFGGLGLDVTINVGTQRSFSGASLTKAKKVVDSLSEAVKTGKPVLAANLAFSVFGTSASSIWAPAFVACRVSVGSTAITADIDMLSGTKFLRMNVAKDGTSGSYVTLSKSLGS